METKELDLTPIRKLIYDITHDADGYHAEGLATLFRKIAIELATHALAQYRQDEYVGVCISDYIYELGHFADAMDEVGRIYNERQTELSGK